MLKWTLFIYLTAIENNWILISFTIIWSCLWHQLLLNIKFWKKQHLIDYIILPSHSVFSASRSFCHTISLMFAYDNHSDFQFPWSFFVDCNSIFIILYHILSLKSCKLMYLVQKRLLEMQEVKCRSDNHNSPFWACCQLIK